MELHKAFYRALPDYSQHHIVPLDHRGQFLAQIIGNTAHEADRHLGGQIELHDIIIDELLKTFIYNAPTVWMVLIFYDKPGKGCQIGIGIGLFIQVLLYNVGIQVAKSFGILLK